jgi:hypothetical protein
MQTTGSCFHCKGCSKDIIDLRGKSQNEIAVELSKNPNLCGVFTSDQLSGQEKVHHSRYYKMAFSFLVALSFIGFNVNPLGAQSTGLKTPEKQRADVCYVGESGAEMLKRNKKLGKTKYKPRRRGLFRKKRKIEGFRTIGCPSF